MASRADRAFEDAFALGRQNQVTVELARRHCLNMEFPEFGGRGMAEEVSGLPINMRRVHCPFGRPSGGASMNLEWLAIEFYETNCVGCKHRRPTGQLPNLASLVEERNRASAAAASAAEQESARRHAEWLGRVDRRRAMAAGAAPPMASALSDVGLVDGDPLVERDREAANDAVRRLEALAERAPEVFTADVASHIVGLVREHGATELLGPLRRLGSRAAVYRADVLGLALEILVDQPLVEAARCLVDLRDGLPPERLDQRVVEAMVMLAGGPERDAFGHRQASSARNDPAGLRLTADLAPEGVEEVLRRLLRTPPAASPLVVPAGTRPPMPDGAASDFERCAAAGAVRRLVATHPAIAGRMTDALARNLGVDDKNQYDDLYPTSEVAHSLAVLLVTGTGEVLAALEDAASAAGEGVRERLFQVLDRARRLLDRQDRWRDPGDPDLDDSRRQECFRVLVEASLARLDGDWGTDVAHAAATLLEELASDEPAWMASYVPALLGAFLLTVNRLDARPARSPLVVIDATSPQMAALEEVSRRQAVHSSALRLLNAVEHIATVDIKGVLAAILAVLRAERETDSELEVAWRVLPLLGKLGGKHGAESGVLRSVLACLHTYLLHTDVALRARAINAWTDIAARHPVPSSLQDLLPTLTADRYVAVVRSVLRAAQRLPWDDGTRRRLLVYAVNVAEATPASDAETLKAALSALLALTRRDDSMRAAGELFVLRKAASRSAWELRHFLHGDWLPASTRSLQPVQGGG